MADARKQPAHQIIDRTRDKSRRAKPPQHGLLRDYRPNCGLDPALETLQAGVAAEGNLKTCETLGANVFVRLKSVKEQPAPSPNEQSFAGPGPVLGRDGHATPRSRAAVQVRWTFNRHRSAAAVQDRRHLRRRQSRKVLEGIRRILAT